LGQVNQLLIEAQTFQDQDISTLSRAGLKQLSMNEEPVPVLMGSASEMGKEDDQLDPNHRQGWEK
jgi:hypothetical protein